MRRVFADTNYWAALVVPGDQWQERALAVSATLGPVRLVTTGDVLAELLDFAAALGVYTRRTAGEAVRDILADPGVDVVPQSHESFLGGLELYEQRPDKSYSLTDCISMSTMRDQGLTDVLSHDRHFTQEGFRALLRE